MRFSSAGELMSNKVAPAGNPLGELFHTGLRESRGCVRSGVAYPDTPTQIGAPA